MTDTKKPKGVETIYNPLKASTNLGYAELGLRCHARGTRNSKPAAAFHAGISDRPQEEGVGHTRHLGRCQHIFAR